MMLVIAVCAVATALLAVATVPVDASYLIGTNQTNTCLKYADHTNRTLCGACTRATTPPTCDIASCPLPQDIASGKSEDTKLCAVCRGVLERLRDEVARRVSNYCRICTAFRSRATDALRLASGNADAVAPEICNAICGVEACTVALPGANISTVSGVCFDAAHHHCQPLINGE